MREPNKVILPEAGKKVLLHSCCAPCSGDVVETLLASKIDFAIFFYNPNIHPREEYERRKQDLVSFAERKHVAFIDSDYNPQDWYARIKGLEKEPEGGKRCTECFSFRFERSARYAHENGFAFLTSCFGVSRWKNMEQVNACGHRAVSAYPGLCYWDHNWRKGGGTNRMDAISKREGFYRQDYCGCAYSLRDAKKD